MKVKISSSGIPKISSPSSILQSNQIQKNPLSSVLTISSEIGNDPGLTPSHRIPNKPSQVKLPFSSVGSVSTIPKPPTSSHTQKPKESKESKEKGKGKKNHSSSSSGKNDKDREKGKEKSKESSSNSKSKHSGEKSSNKKHESSTSSSTSTGISTLELKSPKSHSSHKSSSSHSKKSSSSTSKSSSSTSNSTSSNTIATSSNHTKINHVKSEHKNIPSQQLPMPLEKTSSSGTSTSTSKHKSSTSSSSKDKDKDKDSKKNGKKSSEKPSSDDKKSSKETKSSKKRKNTSTPEGNTIISSKIPKATTVETSGKQSKGKAADNLAKSNDSGSSNKLDTKVNVLSTPVATTHTKKKSEKSSKSTISHGSSKKSIVNDTAQSSTDAANALKQTNSTIESDMKHLLHAFGDVPNPHPETVDMLTKILKLELGGFLYMSDTMASLANSKILGLQEAIAALRRDANRLIRIFDYFGHEEIALRKKSILQNEALKPPVTTDMKSVLRKLNIVDVLAQLDGRLQELEDFDYRNLDAVHPSTSQSSTPKFLAYSLIRNVSLSRKMSVKQLTQTQVARYHYESKVTKTFLKIMEFLVLDIACFLVNSAFSIQQSQELQITKRFLDSRRINEDSCMSAPFFQKKRKDDNDCNQITEILVQASEMEANRLKKDNATKIKGLQQIVNKFNEAPALFSRVNALLPDSLSEAYIRYQDTLNHPSPSFRVQAIRKQKYSSY